MESDGWGRQLDGVGLDLPVRCAKADGAEYVHDLVRIEEIIEGAGPNAFGQFEDLKLERGWSENMKTGRVGAFKGRDGTFTTAPIITKNY